VEVIFQVPYLQRFLEKFLVKVVDGGFCGHWVVVYQFDIGESMYLILKSLDAS
jgi:hypothetical protein